MKVLWARLYPVGAPSQPELPGVPCGGVGAELGRCQGATLSLLRHLVRFSLTISLQHLVHCLNPSGPKSPQSHCHFLGPAQPVPPYVRL